MTTQIPPAPATVSVVVPLHQGAEWISETLTSIQRQSHAPTQVIVVDDGSTDGGGDIARQHPVGATVLAQPSLGVAVARNRGLAAATGNWVTFVDQDDLWHPDHLARTLAWLAAHPGERIVLAGEVAFTAVEDARELARVDGAVQGWADVRVPRASALDALISEVDATGSGDVRRHDARAMLRGPVSMTTSFTADPELLRIAGGFAPHALAMDDYWLLVNVARLVPIPQVDQRTVFYRVHSRATSRTARLGLPFLSSAVALRLGGGIVSLDDGIAGVPVGDLHAHSLNELLASPEYARRRFRSVVDDLARVLWPPDGLARRRRRARLAAAMPRVRDAVRRVRGGGR